MNKTEFYRLMDDVCDLDEGAICGKEKLDDSGFFDSMAMLGLIAMLDESFSRVFKIDELRSIGTVDELYAKVVA